MTEHVNHNEEEWLETHVRSQIDAALDHKLRKLFWAVILMIFGGVSTITGSAIAWGKINQQVAGIIESNHLHHSSQSLHMPMSEKIDLFVPRIELEGNLRQQREQISEVKTAILRVESKIDKL